jgi:DNA-binding phage protein
MRLGDIAGSKGMTQDASEAALFCENQYEEKALSGDKSYNRDRNPRVMTG